MTDEIQRAHLPMPFNPYDYPDRVCCGFLEHMEASGLDTFFRPEFLELPPPRKKGPQPPIVWAVHVYSKNNPLKEFSVILKLGYCPFCGKRLVR